MKTISPKMRTRWIKIKIISPNIKITLPPKNEKLTQTMETISPKMNGPKEKNSPKIENKVA
jgi:hypothetical protein